MAVGDWRSLGKAWDGTEQFHRTDPVTGEMQLKTTYADASAVTDRNAHLRSMGRGNGKDMKLAASIPLSVVFKWRAEHGVDIFSNDPAHRKKARQLLNDHNYKMLRVWEGHI